MSGTEFTKEQFLSIYPDGIENHYWTHARNLIIEKTLKKNKLKNENILEIGSGRGVVVNFLRKKGFNCEGVELSDNQSSEVSSDYIKYGVDFNDLDTNYANSIKVILLLDVLEHIENDVHFLKNIKQKFPNLKGMIITVPARKELWSNYDTYNLHYRRYNIENLHKTLNQATLQGKSRYFFHFLYFPAKLLLATKKTRSTTIKAPKGFQILFHKLTAILFYIEHLILPKKMPGTSIITFCI